MSWRIDPINLLYAVVLTSLAGTLVTLIWYGIGRLLERTGFLNVLYGLLRTVAVFWLVPLSFLAEWYLVVVRNRQGGPFMASPMIVKVSRGFGFVWSVGVAVYLLWYLLQLLQIRLRLRAAMECETAVRQLFDRVCEEYGIPAKRVRVMQSYREGGPKVVGVLHPCVLLPVKSYPQEDLEVIFRHELMHVQQRDLLTKNLGVLLRGLHFFNPAAWWYVRLLNRWSEFACDYRVCVEKRELKSYYRQLLSMAEQEDGVGLVSQLAENPGELRERMEHVMKSYRCGKNRRMRAAAALLVGCMVLASSGTVYAATRSSAKVMAVWAEVTEVAMEVPLQELPELQEYTEGPGFDIVVVDGEVEQRTKGSRYYFDWDIAGGTGCKSPSFWKTQGETIKVNASVNPMNLTVKVGIIQPDGNKVYVTGSDTVIHTFTATQTGNYRVYIENRNSESVTATGYYYEIKYTLNSVITARRSK